MAQDSEGQMTGYPRRGAKTITRDDMAKKLKKYVKRLSGEKLLESYRFATIVECFGQLSEALFSIGKKDEGELLMGTASTINEDKIPSALKGKETKKSITDTDLINFLESKNKENKYTGRCIFRTSGTGRGWRLHETDMKFARTTVRKAITDAIIREEEVKSETK